MPIPSERELYR